MYQNKVRKGKTKDGKYVVLVFNRSPDAIIRGKIRKFKFFTKQHVPYYQRSESSRYWKVKVDTMSKKKRKELDEFLIEFLHKQMIGVES